MTDPCVGGVVYGVDENKLELVSASIVKVTAKQLVLDSYLFYIDLNGTTRFSKTVQRKFIPAKGLPTTALEAVQEVYRTLIYEILESRARYDEMLRGISVRQEKMDGLVKSLQLNPLTAKYPPIRRKFYGRKSSGETSDLM